MPLYDYRCHTCGSVFEVRQKFSDELLTVHDGCGGKVERLISLSALRFKGTGWYITDYARKKGGNGSSGDKPAETAAKSESKGEFKPEAKSESKPAVSESKK